MTDKKQQLIPSAGYILISPAEKELKTASGIYLPDNAGDKPQKGTIISIGADDVNEHGIKKSAPAKVGDVVVYKKWGANEVKLNGEDYLFVKFEDILAIIK